VPPGKLYELLERIGQAESLFRAGEPLRPKL
jgi:hypothetical protein